MNKLKILYGSNFTKNSIGLYSQHEHTSQEMLICGNTTKKFSNEKILFEFSYALNLRNLLIEVFCYIFGFSAGINENLFKVGENISWFSK